MQAHARYIERDGRDKDHKELGFDATSDQVDIALTARNWALAKDWRHWRMILSPEDHERVEYARAYAPSDGANGTGFRDQVAMGCCSASQHTITSTSTFFYEAYGSKSTRKPASAKHWRSLAIM